MRAIRLTLVSLLSAVTLFCCSCQGRVTSTPQAVTQEPAEAVQETAPPSQEPAASQEPRETPLQDASSVSVEPAQSAQTPVGYEIAVEAVLAQHDGALPLECSLDYDDGLTLYEIAVLGSDGNVYEVQVDAMSGTLLRTETDDDGTGYTQEMIKIPYAQAVSTAMDLVGDCTFESFEIDTNNAGTIVYDIELLDAQRWKQEVQVDASTGTPITGTAKPDLSQPAVAGADSGAAYGHHPDAHHNTAQSAIAPLAESMVVSSQASFDLCGRCNQYPCACSSGPSGADVEICAVCGENPCVCSPDQSYSGGSADASGSAAWAGGPSGGRRSRCGSHHSNHHG